ncbi:MAG: acyltransferase [Planctomycetota bacterium]|jgi:acetyltransferase-like isoleucine patch superfamily enzyme
MAPHRPSGVGRVLRRFFVPRFVVSIYHYLKNGSRISPRAEVEFSPNLQLGARSVVASFTKIKARGVLATGDNCQIANGCFISAWDAGIRIGDNLMCGPNVTIVSGSYGYSKLGVPYAEQEPVSKGVEVGSNVWIGASTVVLDGTVLGDNTIVVANSMVNRRYPPNCILQGNPAKIVLRRDKSTGEET